MSSVRRLVSAASLVSFPLLFLTYWLLYPAYGELNAGAILRGIDGHTSLTTVADLFAIVAVFLAVPATLALMRVLAGPSPRLALIGGSLALGGWISLLGILMTDVVAVEMVNLAGPTNASVDLFGHIMNSPLIIALNVVVALHVVGGIVIGIALYRTRLIPRWGAIAATVSPPIHVGANLAGLLWLDAIAWIALAAAYAYVARIVMRSEAR
jgi:hypothetical protein